MAFDYWLHEKKRLMVEFGRYLKRKGGVPEADVLKWDITALYREVTQLLGEPFIETTSKDVGVTPDGKETPERQERKAQAQMQHLRKPYRCPKCKELTAYPIDLCHSCKGVTQGNKYLSRINCVNPDCKYMEDFEKPIGHVMKELWGVEVEGMKKDYGIPTLTDEGLKEK